MTSASAQRDAVEAAIRPTLARPGVLGLAATSHPRACALLVLLALISFLPGLASLQPMDRDEPRFAQASKQMLETGDFVDIRFQEEARHKKPVGIYWLQSAAVATAEAAGFSRARTSIAFYRLPSLVGATAAVLLTYWAALAFVGRPGAFLAAALIGSSVILLVEARLAKTDAVLAACAVAAMGALARAYLGRSTRSLPLLTALIFWAALAVGILIKGPLVPMFAGLCALSLCARERSGRWLLAVRPGLGLLLTSLLVAPWFVAIAWKSGGAFFAESVGHDMIGKVGTAQTQHWAPPGTYLLAFFGTFWPGAALAALAAPFAWTRRREDPVAFCLAWVVPSWLVFEAVPTKLPHYVLPLYPAFAILTAMAIERGAIDLGRVGARLVALLVPLVPAGLLVGIAVAAWSLDGVVPWAGLALLIASTALGLAAYVLFTWRELEASVLAGIAASLALSAGVFGFVQPALVSFKLSPRLAAVAGSLGCANPRVATLGYREPSLVFLVGTDLLMLDSPREAAAFLSQQGCRLAFVEKRFEGSFQEAMRETSVESSLAGRVAGFNINGGRFLDIAAYAVTP